MSRIYATLALLVLALTSCAATLAVHGTAPVTLAEGSCYRFTETPAEGRMWVFASVESAALVDSLWLSPGEAFAFRWTVPSGSYRVLAWARNEAGVSCSTNVVVTAQSRPSPVRIGP